MPFSNVERNTYFTVDITPRPEIVLNLFYFIHKDNFILPLEWVVQGDQGVKIQIQGWRMDDTLKELPC